MSGAFAATGLLGHRRSRIPSVAVALVMVLASAQALGYAGVLVRDAPNGLAPWNHDGSDPGARTLARGMPARVAAAGDRLALWPGVREEMRLAGRPGTDWVDAGQGLVTAWTKNRTTARLVGANGYLFDQAIDLPPQVLCDAATVSFLRLRHLVLPPDQKCEGWVLSNARIDERWSLAAWVAGEDARVRAVPAASLTDSLREEPALSGTSTLIHRLIPQEGTVLELDPARSALRISGGDGVGPRSGRGAAGCVRPGLAGVFRTDGEPSVDCWQSSNPMRENSARGSRRTRACVSGGSEWRWRRRWPCWGCWRWVLAGIPSLNLASHKMYYVNQQMDPGSTEGPLRA